MKSLATLYRPVSFEDVCGQNSTVKILNKQVETDNIKNCYLFCGPSGCGKTTIARIFSNKINNNFGSPIEIDAASNNGVDNIKNIVKSAAERSINSKYKVYIIDECHSLTTQAWQAFLKCIEEPPRYTIFIFCTTESNKVPDTIKNRCQVFNFTRLSSDIISNRLKYICSNENLLNYADACDYISRICNNQMRDAISILEKAISYSDSTILDMNSVYNSTSDINYKDLFNLLNNMIDGNESFVIEYIENIFTNGIDLNLFVNKFLDFCFDLSKYIITHKLGVTKIPNDFDKDVAYSTSFNDSMKYYNYYIDKLIELKELIKGDMNVKLSVEVIFLKMTRLT